MKKTWHIPVIPYVVADIWEVEAETIEEALEILKDGERGSVCFIHDQESINRREVLADKVKDVTKWKREVRRQHAEFERA
tara:strand:+ start:298 stop:537 length:240 start_codon:yes stop_codon:yes gene_type:complete